jgi:hypothetical protein
MRLTLAILTLLLFAPAADAAWSGQTLSSGHTFVDDPSVIVSGNGGALAAWRFQEGLGNGSRVGTGGASRAPGAAGFGARVAIVPATRVDRPLTTVAGLAPYGRSRALLALITARLTTPQSRLAVRFGSTDGRFGRLRTIRRARQYSVQRASLAVNARGDAALAWFEDRGVRTDRVYVALRRAGHGFGAPRRLATGRIRGVAAAVGERGDVLVSWDARGVVRTRFKGRGARGFRATDTIRSEPAFNADMHPVITPSGRAVLAWSAQFTSEGGSRGPVFFQAATRAPGARRFSRARVLETIPARDDDGLGRGIDAVLDTAGVVAIAWRGRDGVRASRGGAPAQTLSVPGTTAVFSDLAAGPGGRLVAVWDDGVDSLASVVHAAVADGAGAPFGPPEDVTAVGRDSRFGHAAFLGERPVVVLASRPTRQSPTVAQAYVR